MLVSVFLIYLKKIVPPYIKLAYLSFEKKIEYLYKLIKAKKIVTSGEELVELEDWCRKAHNARHERNRYMHGIWSFLPHLENGVEVNITPWAKSKYGASHKNRMSLNDLRGIVKSMWTCHTEFLAIRDKYGI